MPEFLSERNHDMNKMITYKIPPGFAKEGEAFPL
jgi:hypothetical protein